MYAENKLSQQHKNEFEKAKDKVTIEELESLDYGDEIELTENFTLYHYSEDEIVVINFVPDWDEIYQLLWDKESGDIIFEVL